MRGFRVLDLHGTDARVGELYATLLRDELLGEWIPMNEEQHYAQLPPAFRAIFVRLQARFPDYLDPRNDARGRALEQALGLEEGAFRRYAWLADLGSLGPALELALGGTVQLDATSGTLTDRCTTVVGRDGERTVHARNLDYWGMDYWQPNATITFVEPLAPDGTPDGLRYAHLGTVGELLAGTTGVNEAGLAVSTHLHVSRDVAVLRGRPRMSALGLAADAFLGEREREGESVYVLVERVLRDARTVEDAIALLEASRPIGAWSFVLSDPAGGRAVVDIDWAEHRTHRGAVVDTNFFLDPAMRAREAHPSRGPIEGSVLRYERALELLGDGALDAEGAVAILRDRFDGAVGRERPVSANSILSPDTSQSVVVVTGPDAGPLLWIAEPAPDGRTPAALQPFFALSFADGFAGPGRAVQGTVPGVPADDPARSAYLSAMHLALDRGDRAAAAAVLRGIHTDDPGIHLMAAWASASVGELEAAREALARVDPARASHHHRLLADWLRGELAWRAGDTDRARAAFTSALASIARDGSAIDGPLAWVLADRLDRLPRRPRHDLPFPNLKFQDVLELRVRRGSRPPPEVVGAGWPAS